ncbi:Symplekin tight junction protein C terminal-domain-containing protein [Globomyces pollinis-pini]|nr:Symplekin tight junction protein C terminal-domain-containing protein [Globomyces pollinis-pini]
MDIQSITQSLQKGTVDQKKQAIVECIPLSEDVGTFATTLLPYILPLHSIQELRVDILLLLENLILNCSRSTCGDPIKFAVLASAIEAVVVILSDPKIEMQNRAIRALGNIYPYAFKIFCKVPGDAKYWSIISELKRYIDAQFENANEGIRANSLLFLQNMILSQTPSLSEEDISLDLVPVNHAYLKTSQLQLESNAVLNRYILFLANVETIKTSCTFLCLVLQSMYTIIKKRSDYALPCCKVLLEFHKKSPTYFSPLQSLSINRCLKIILISCYSLPSLSIMQHQLYDVLMQLGCKPHQLHKREPKRSAGNDLDREGDYKRMRTDSTESILEANHTNHELLQMTSFDQVPLHLIVDSIINAFISRDEISWQTDIRNYLLSFGIIQPNFTPVAVAEPAIVDEPTMVEEEVEAEVDQLPQIDLEIDVDAILAASYEYSDEESHQLVLDSYKRILNMEAHFTVSGKGKTVVIPDAKDTVIASKYGWMLLISRMLTRTNADNEAKSAFSQFVFERFHSRMDLAILWLCEEFSADSLDNSSNGYQIWFHNMLDMLKGGDVDPSDETFTGLDPRDRAFTKFLVEVPQLTEYAMTRIHEYCRDSARMQLGLATFRDLIIYRPAVRDECLNYLLEFCESLNSDIRSNAVAAAKTFVPGHETIGPIVKEKAISNFDKLFQYTKVENTDEEDGEVVVENDQNIQRYMDLYLGCCLKSKDMLTNLFDLCHKLPENVFKCLSVAIVPIFKEFFVDPDYLFQLIQDFPEGSESLVLVLIKSLMSNEDLEQRAIEETKTIFQKRNLGVNFLLLIIKSLDKESILLNLGKLVDSLDESEAQAAIVKSVFVSLVEVPVSENMEETAKALLTPAELLVKLHNLEDSVGLKKVLEACNICFSEPLIYKEDALGTVLNQLSNQIKLPTLFMRTVLQSISAFKGFGVNSILTRLITKQIWTNPQLWNGFIRCCTITFPASIPVLLALPDAQGKDVLENSPKLKTGLTEYLDRLPDHQQGRREFIQLSALLSSS